jgi:ribosome-associated protein
MLVITDTLMIPDEEFSWTFSRAGGPGGQNVNKVASAALLRWNAAANSTIPFVVKQRLFAAHPSGLTQEGEFLISSREFRDQERNRERCREKLITWLREALIVPEIRRPTKPTKSSQLRRVADKRKLSAKKTDRRGNISDD